MKPATESVELMCAKAANRGLQIEALRRRRRRVFRTLNEIRAALDGPPLTLAELTEATGFSREKVRMDIVGGYLHGCYMGYGSRTMYVIDLAEAQRYLRGLGLL